MKISLQSLTENRFKDPLTIVFHKYWKIKRVWGTSLFITVIFGRIDMEVVSNKTLPCYYELLQGD